MSLLSGPIKFIRFYSIRKMAELRLCDCEASGLVSSSLSTEWQKDLDQLPMMPPRLSFSTHL